MMRRARGFAGFLILASYLLCLSQAAMASPQASKASPAKGTVPKSAAPKSDDGKTKGVKGKDAEKSSNTTAVATDADPATPVASDEIKSKFDGQKKPAKKLSRAEKKEAAISGAHAAVKEMIRKLSKGEYVEFIDLHFPIEAYVTQLRSGQPTALPLSAIPKLTQMKAALERLQDGDISIDPTHRVVTFKAKEDAKAEKVIHNPYATEPSELPSYKGDLPEVIAAALKDLNAESYEDCMSRLLPPSTIHMMKTDDRWDGMIESLSPESPMIASLVSDLEKLSKEKASVDGDTAEYRLPNVINVVLDENDVEEEEAGERLIRFSRINGTWRFFDSNAKTREELEAALKRDAVGEASADVLVVERIGSDWRLLQVPGMPPVRQ